MSDSVEAAAVETDSLDDAPRINAVADLIPDEAVTSLQEEEADSDGQEASATKAPGEAEAEAQQEKKDGEEEEESEEEKVSSFYGRLKRKEKALQKREEDFQQRNHVLEQRWSELQKRAGQLHDAWNGLRSGNAASILNSLSALTGLPGLQVLEEINSAIARDGQADPARDVQELRRQLEEQKRQAEEQQKRQQAQQEQQQALQSIHRKFGKAVLDENRWPLIAEAAKQNPDLVRDQAFQYWHSQFHSGRRLDLAATLSELELYQAKTKPAQAEAPQASANPPARQRKAGRTLDPTASGAPGRARSVDPERARIRAIAELPFIG